MKSELFLIVYKHLEGIFHELSAHVFHIGRKSGGKHHNLLLVRSCLEYGLNISSHVSLLKHFVALIQDKELELRQIKNLLLD